MSSSNRKFWTLIGYAIAVEADSAEEAFILLTDGLVDAAEKIRAGAEAADVFVERVIELDEKGKKTFKNTNSSVDSLSTSSKTKKWTSN